MPTTRSSMPMTGIAPQSASHMFFTTSARFVSGRQLLTSIVIAS